MGRIRILSDHVANKIAAGEVVERPASVVKELLENSLDAGATDLRVDIENGGRRLIRITDNGCGMLRDDALLAFERHATSKLSDVKDLLAIATLGFRGEALPSIASVSRLMLETRSPDETTGTRVEIAGGKLLRCDEAALAGGTVITVRDLFFNVPARKKFLRSEQTELAHIASLVTHYSLAHPGKSIELYSGANELLSVTPAAELRERVYQVFGKQTLDTLIELGVREREMLLPAGDAGEEGESLTFRLHGFVSQPQVQKGNRNSIYLFVNRRLIRDKLLLHALSAAYHNLMPPAAFPFALLFLECEPSEVDVNVHPSKTEVRFRHGPFVHDFVRDAVRQALIEARPASSIPLPVSASPTPQTQPQRAPLLPYSEFTQALESRPDEPDRGSPPPLAAHPPPEAMLPEFPLSPVHSEPVRLRVPETHAALPHGLLQDAAPSLTSLPSLRPLGQIHESFIIAAGADGLWIVDQHVAHERILFEKILKQRGRSAVEKQQLLMPALVELTPGQHLQYERIRAELESMGFEIEPFGPRTIAVQTVPADLALAEVERVLFEVFEIAEAELRRASPEDLRRGIAASLACRAAIKVNMRLDAAKISWLLDELARCDYPMSCPHGRPIALRYATRDILRGFHRA